MAWNSDPRLGGHPGTRFEEEQVRTALALLSLSQRLEDQRRRRRRSTE